MTNQSADKKPLPRAGGTSKGVEKLRQKYKVVITFRKVMYLIHEA